MADNPEPVAYVRLPGKGSRSGQFITTSRSTLWIGPDHLLQVDASRISEEYKRFYLSDIKAIIIRRTSKSQVANLIFGTLTLGSGALFGLIAMSASQADRTVIIIAGAIIAGFCLLILIVNGLKGPTCICHLRTPVQQEELPSLNRLRNAQKALAAIQPLIAEAQGALPPEASSGIASAISTYGNIPLEAVKQEAVLYSEWAGEPPMEKKGAALLLRVALIVSILSDAGLGYFLYSNQNSVLFFELHVAVGMLVGLFAIALVILRPANDSGFQKSVPWPRFAFWTIQFLIAAGYGAAASIQYSLRYPGRSQFVNIDQLLPYYHDSYYSLVEISAVLFVIWALVELVLLLMVLRGGSQSPPSSDPSHPPTV